MGDVNEVFLYTQGSMSPFLNPVFLISILVALSFHEWAHGYVANKLGDPTAEMYGRLTLNPLAHLDPMGTILFLLVGFGWGKPVPVDPTRFRHPKRDTALVSLAGPVSNLLLAFISFLALVLVFPGSARTVGDLLSTPSSGGPVGMTFLHLLFQSLLFLNLGLMAFNLLPVAPLDGSKVLHAFIPYRYEDTYQNVMRWGPYILLGLLLAESFLGFPFLSAWIEGIMSWVLSVFGLLIGKS